MLKKIDIRVVSIVISVFLIVNALVIARYLSFHSNLYDMGVFDNLIWLIYVKKSIRPLLELNWAFSLILLLYVPFYYLYSSAITLLLLQTSAVLSSFIPIYLILKKENLEGRYLLWIALILYPPLWWNVFFDFHPDHLIIPLALWGMYFLSTNRISLFIISCIIIMLVRVDFAFTVAALGVYAAVKHRRYKVGAAFFIIGSFYGIVVIDKVVPYFCKGFLGASYLSTKPAFKWLGTSMSSIILNLLSNPFVILKEFLLPEKILYLFKTIGALMFIPLFSPIELIPALPRYLFSLLSHESEHYGASNQYQASIIPFVYVAFIYGWKNIEKAMARFCSSGMRPVGIMFFFTVLIAHILFSPSPISRNFWFNKDYEPFYRSAYMITERDNIIWEAIKKYVPEDMEVSVTTQNNINNSYLAHRKFYWPFPLGVTSPVKATDGLNRMADLVILDQKRSPMVIDTVDSRTYQDIFRIVNSEYLKIYEYDGFFIFKKRST